MDPFVAEIRIFPFNFPPRGWSWCNGQLLPLSQNTALFSLLGTTYGGDGRTTFALPDLQGRAPMHSGRGPGLTLRRLGEKGGTEKVTLLESEIPAHSHTVGLTPQPGEIADPSAHTIARSSNGAVFKAGNPTVNMSASSIASSGGGQPHNNLQPYLTTYFCIALQGVYPQRG
ncbi:microcystin-dependent protein [Dyadobacter jejuensis]|uniref:Microcystin-dependent protein n=1 Tax=Dyadobacter jejuensis TaxID=1082580 RepID=A0A316AJS0_9BACT|nr:tail fiber protein [Dyadobacter jejuensis]PWJ58075.1 microcystin-dependent protein [Dyadobacter jejuensis]